MEAGTGTLKRRTLRIVTAILPALAATTYYGH